jgi:hypothetical protein
MANEIVGSGGVKLFSLGTLSELIVKCVIGFGRLMRILEN